MDPITSVIKSPETKSGLIMWLLGTRNPQLDVKKRNNSQTIWKAQETYVRTMHF
jgi:hypothetical protein